MHNPWQHKVDKLWDKKQFTNCETIYSQYEEQKSSQFEERNILQIGETKLTIRNNQCSQFSGTDEFTW